MKIKGHIKNLDLSSLPMPGINKFQVIEAQEGKSGVLDVLKLKLKLYPKKGKSSFMQDEILATDVYKLDKFSRAIGIKNVFEKGQLTVKECLNKTGSIRLFLKQQTNNCMVEDSAYQPCGNGYIPADEL